MKPFPKTLAEVRYEAMACLLAIIDVARTTQPPDSISPAQALRSWADIAERTIREQYGAEYDRFKRATRRDGN